MYCLDTNIIVEYLRGNKNIINKIAHLSKKGEIYTTTINLCELYKGIHLSKKADKELFILDEFAQSISVLDLTLPICRRFGERFASLKSKGKIVSEFDLMIASIADANGLVLITKNKKHFESIGVRLEVW